MNATSSIASSLPFSLEEADRLERIALVWKVLSAISFVAFAAIMGVALVYEIGLMVIPALAFFQFAAVKCIEKSNESMRAARIIKNI